jgi:hypothetical protein
MMVHLFCACRKKYSEEVRIMSERKSKDELREEMLVAHRARMARLKDVAATINRGPTDEFFGADFHLAFNYLCGEIKVLQDEPEFAALRDRLETLLSSSEAVLYDSINPVENNKRIAEMSNNQHIVNQ